jgi:hypothetical protein
VLPVLLAMAMAQVEVLPASPWQVIGPTAPIAVTGEPSIVWDGTAFQVGWVDRRRNPGREFLTDPVDLWMASVGPAGFGRPVSLSATRETTPSFRLVASGSNVVAVRQRSTGVQPVSDYEVRVVGATPLSWSALPSLPTPSPSLVALNGTNGIILARVNGLGVSGVTFGPGGSATVSVNAPGFSLTSIAASGAGFIFATDTSSGVLIRRLVDGGSAGGQQLDPTTESASVVAGPGMEYAVAHSAMGGLLRVHDVDGGVALTQWPVAQAPATQAITSLGRDWAFGWTTAGVTSYRAFRGRDAGPIHAVSGAGAVTSMALGTVAPDAGMLSVVERFPGGYGVRQMTVLGQLSFGMGASRMLTAPSPVRAPSVVWSAGGFLLSFDQADGGAARVTLSPATPTLPAPIPLGSGDLSAVQLGRTNAGPFALDRPAGTHTIVPLQSGMQIMTPYGFGVATQATGGPESIIVWLPSETLFSYRLFQTDGGVTPGTMQTLLPTPSCLGVSGDRFVLFDPFIPALFRIGNPGVFTEVPMGVVSAGLGNRAKVCTAVTAQPVTGAAFRRSDGALAVVTAAGGMILGDGSEVGPQISGDPQLVPFGAGFLAAAIGAEERLRFFTVTVRGEVSAIPQADTDPGVVEFSLADSPDAGLAAAAWQWFDEDAGAMVVGARVFRVMPGTNTDGGSGVDAGLDGGLIDAGLMDAGVPDAGPTDAGVADAGLMDAGLDAGLIDAGLIDAGLIDAGLIDAGLIDAGLIDAGLTDAGALDAAIPDGGVAAERGGIVFIPTGCGCTSASLPPFLVCGLLVLARRSRRVR